MMGNVKQVALDLHRVVYLLSLDDELPFSEFVERRVASTEAFRRLGAPRASSLLHPDVRARLAAGVSASNRRLLDALRKPPAALAFDDDAGDWTTLEEARASSAFQRHKTLADELFLAA